MYGQNTFSYKGTDLAFQGLFLLFGWGFLNPKIILNCTEISDFPVFHCMMAFSVSIQRLRTDSVETLASFLIPAPCRIAYCTLVVGLLLAASFSHWGYLLNIATMH